MHEIVITEFVAINLSTTSRRVVKRGWTANERIYTQLGNGMQVTMAEKIYSKSASKNNIERRRRKKNS